MNKKTKRISIIVPEELHREIKIISSATKVSMKKYILQSLALKLINDRRMLS